MSFLEERVIVELICTFKATSTNLLSFCEKDRKLGIIARRRRVTDNDKDNDKKKKPAEEDDREEADEEGDLDRSSSESEILAQNIQSQEKLVI